ncbi:uncharacterized protein LOC125492261 [Beta vulgaris subsp. vulgaris]|uniref:uncharacterized protein LOC125492261 n=1 Tax=Beta vulgaris subsp. vulgaris TaxID=3555 RepID=UPI002546ABBD|nr:uncharacterized protein LOC125492261 [Beta vulgaris subsp. vulgaris]
MRVHQMWTKTASIFLIAYGIVDTESTPNWTYFFGNLRICFEKVGCNRDDWTFISDRMRGVDNAVNDVFPRATRRVFCQNLYMNCKNVGYSRTTFHKLFWTAVDAYNEYVFKNSMQKIHAYNPEVVTYLDSCIEQWSKHVFDPLVCCDPIRNWSMGRIRQGLIRQLTWMQTCSLITQSRSYKLGVMNLGFAMLHHVGGEFEVRDGNVNFPIRLVDGKCGCGKWQGYGIPCKPALRVIFDERLEAANFVSPYFKGAAYKATYGEHIHPMDDPSYWTEHTLLLISPPDVKRGAGRSRK